MFEVLRKKRQLTNDNSIVGSLNDGAIKLDDVAVAEDAEDFSLSDDDREREQKCFYWIKVVAQMVEYPLRVEENI